MDTKHIHCMLEKISEYGKEMIEAGAGSGNVNLDDAGKIVDMVKDLACAEKDALIAKEMRKAHEDEEAEEKYMMKMLKEENKDEYKRMREEYGEDEGERRFYDNYRYKRTGEFAPKGRGSYMPRRGGRRGYEEPMYHIPLEMMGGYDIETLRDMDRQELGRMYYSGGSNGSSTGNSGGRSGSSGMSGGNMGGNSGGGSSRGYSEGYSDGQSQGYEEGNRRGYEDGYREGERSGRNRGGRDGREGRSGQSRRSYMETKEMNKGNSPQEKQEKMKELEKYMGELSGDITEMIGDASNEEKTMLKTKLQTLAQKIQ